MIKIAGLTKNYGLTPVLRGVDLHVQAGEFVTLIGANGAGKSTLLRIVATLAKPTAGEVSIGGWPLHTHAHEVRQHIGLVSHHSLLYTDLTAAENLDFFARLYGLEDKDDIVQAALKRVGLLARQRDAVRTFSRGMLQRLAIARATLHTPDVLLLDEPYTGLDQEASTLLDELLTKEREFGRTIFLITHDINRGLNLCDRIAILNRGTIAMRVAREGANESDVLHIYNNLVRGSGGKT